MDIILNEASFPHICDLLGKQDAELKDVVVQYGYPPYWSRPPGFETLIHIILEQQVSLASAKAALNKLQARVGEITPANVNALSDDELKACYFSRQKIKYARHLANMLLIQSHYLEKLALLPDNDIAVVLKQLPGIGDWTVDIYLMMALHRPDRFPLGDIALIRSLKQIKNLSNDTKTQDLQLISDTWKPYRTVAAYLLWHAYLSRNNQLSATAYRPSAANT